MNIFNVQFSIYVEKYLQPRTWFATWLDLSSILSDTILHAWKIHACPFDACICPIWTSNASEQNYELMNISPPTIAGDAWHFASACSEIISREYFSRLPYGADFSLILVLSAIWIASAQLHFFELFYSEWLLFVRNYIYMYYS